MRDECLCFMLFCDPNLIESGNLNGKKIALNSNFN